MNDVAHQALRPHCGLWADTAPPAPQTTHLSGSLSADVLVIGAGYTGLSTALHLAELGASVVLLEAAEIGYGGSGRNVGLVNAGLWLPPDAVAKAAGPQYGERLLQSLGEGPQVVFDLIANHGISCEAVRSGTLHCATNASGTRDLARRAKQWQLRGAAVQMLNRAETAKATGSQVFLTSLLDPRAGTIQPLAYARGLARAAIDAGVRIFTRSAATSTSFHNGTHTVWTGDGYVRAHYVVVATDMYSVRPWELLRSEQVRLPYFNVATMPLDKSLLRTILPQKQGAWDTRKVLSSFRLDSHGHLIFGSVGALSGAGQDVHRAWARRALGATFPQLGKISLKWCWHGSIGMTGNYLPRFHRLATNVIAVNGYNGRGIAPGTVFGRYIAQFIAGRISERELPLPITQPRAAFLRLPREIFYQSGSRFAHFVQARFTKWRAS